MKLIQITAAFVLLLSPLTFGQQKSKITKSSALSNIDDSKIGLRMSVYKPILDLNIEAKYDNNTVDYTSHFDDTAGLSIGYGYLPIQSLGFVTNLNYIYMHKEFTTLGLTRFDASLAFAFNSIVHMKAGLNYSKFNKGDGYIEFDGKMGYQAGVGIQITRTLTADISYVNMNQEKSFSNYSYKLSEVGPEIALGASF